MRLPDHVTPLVAAREARPYSDVKLDAVRAGQPLPIEPGDFIVWEVSYRVAGYVIEIFEGEFARQPMTLIRFWNIHEGREGLLPLTSVKLQGYG